MVVDDQFTVFWDGYPKKTAKRAAARAFAKAIAKVSLDTLLDALARHKQTEQWQRRVIPHAATWLNGERWEDEGPHLPRLVSPEDQAERAAARASREERRLAAEEAAEARAAIAYEALSAEARAALERRANGELQTYRERMTFEAYQTSVQNCVLRYLREGA